MDIFPCLEWTMAALLGGGLMACGPDPEAIPAAGSSSSTTDDLDSSTAAEAHDEESSTGAGSSTGDGELAECFDTPDRLLVRLRSDVITDIWNQSSFLGNTPCELEPSQVSEEAGVLRTDTGLQCSGVDSRTGEPVVVPFELTVEGAAIDLGTDPIDVSFFYELGPDHTSGSEADHSLRIHRDDRLLVYATYDRPVAPTMVGGTQRLGETRCLYYGDCGLPIGIEGTGPGGELVQELTGAAVVLSAGDQSFLVSADGLEPRTCADGTGPADEHPRLRVGAVDTELLVPG